MRTTSVRDIGDFEEVIWFADVPGIVGSHCITHEDRGSDGEWIALERPRVPPRPQAPSVLWGWLADEALAVDAEPELRDLEEGEDLPNEVIAAYSTYLDAWRTWATEHAPRLALPGLDRVTCSRSSSSL